ncbi:MAG: hypothetical protein WHT65_06315 [Pseudothermotoga sp.]
MKKFIVVSLLIFSTIMMAEVYFWFDSSLGFSVYNELYTPEKKSIKAMTDYGMQVGFDYGLKRGLRMGVSFGYLNMSVATDLGSVNSNLMCVGLVPSFTFDFLDVVSQLSGGVLFVLAGPTGSLAGFGLSGTSNFQGWIYTGKIDFLWELSEQFSVGVGVNARFHDLNIPTRDLSLRSLSVPVSLKISYRF